MVGIAPQRSNFFVRSNYAIGVERERQRERTAVEKEKQSLLAGTQSVLSLTEQAVGKIERGAHADAALRELWAFLLELRHLRASDPGIRMAAQDLYEAAQAGERAFENEARARGASMNRSGSAQSNRACRTGE